MIWYNFFQEKIDVFHEHEQRFGQKYYFWNKHGFCRTFPMNVQKKLFNVNVSVISRREIHVQ